MAARIDIEWFCSGCSLSETQTLQFGGGLRTELQTFINKLFTTGETSVLDYMKAIIRKLGSHVDERSPREHHVCAPDPPKFGRWDMIAVTYFAE